MSHEVYKSVVETTTLCLCALHVARYSHHPATRHIHASRERVETRSRPLCVEPHGYARVRRSIMTDVAEIWVWTVELVPEGKASMPDISGYDVSARDGNIGK